MTDYRSTIAGSYQGKGPVVMCILNEGAPTFHEAGMIENGREVNNVTWATPLKQNQVIALANDAQCLYVETEGMPVVERAVNAETLLIGEIVTQPHLETFPTSTDASWDTLVERLAGKVYRTALVELHVPGRIVQASIMADGSHPLVPGVATTANFNMASAYASGGRGYHFDLAAANGVGLIPLHYVPAGSDGDLYSALVLLTGLGYSVTGTA